MANVASNPVDIAKKELSAQSEFLKTVWSSPVDLNRQSVEVGRAENENETAPRRNARTPTALVTGLFPGIETCEASFRNAAKNWGNRPCLGYRPIGEDKKAGKYVFQTYSEIYDRVLAVGSGLSGLGLKKGDTVGIYAKNRVEWALTMEACSAQSLVTVAIYDTFGPQNIEFVIKHADISVVIASVDGIKKLLDIAPKCPTLRHLVQMDGNGDKPIPGGDKLPSSIQLIPFSELEAKGKSNPVPPNPPAPEDLALIMYTSGTTGAPKGVMHNHRALISTMAAVSATLGGITCEDTYISYLPLAHILEREAITAMFAVGCAVGFFQGDIVHLVDDIECLKPTLMAGVPRVYERIMAKVKGTIEKASWTKQMLFNYAYNYKKGWLEVGQDTPWTNWLVFGATKARLGGRMRLLISGGAPLAPPTQEFVKICFCAPVVQGYGLTETCAAGGVTDSSDPKFGHIGPPVSSVEIKLVSVPDMGYLARDNTGEIWIRGPPVSMGYHKDPEKTKEDFVGGWFKTGDIGRWNPNGTLSIIDRVKNFFKLAQGEYVAAEKLELVYQRCKLATQVFIHGESLETSVVAVVVPNKEMVMMWGAANKPGSDYDSLVKSAELKKEYMTEFAKLAKDAGFAGFEVVRALHIHPDEFTIEQDLITPTMKLRRPQLKKFFEGELKRMYDDLRKTSTTPGL